MHHVRALLRGLILLTLLGLAGPGLRTAWAWDDFGHMTIAAVAWQDLSPAARVRASALLRLNPDYGGWVGAAAPDRRDVVAFLKAATWADAIKHEAGFEDDAPSAAPAANLNVGYADHREHRSWHYVNTPFSPDGTPLPDVPTPNAATRVADFRRALADPHAPAGIRSYDLVWLLHLVADLHQPLHAVSRYTRELPEGDLGGNRIRLCAPPCRQELHAFWDGAVGHGGVMQALALAHRLAPPPRRAAADPRIADWLAESVGIARHQVYEPPVGPGAGPYFLTREYREQARRIARARAALAGRRLAVLLEGALRSGGPASGIER
jgi:S1/P1 Nuclease